ncbi:MAG: CRISPR-associated endonuclease Cas1 [Magnetococcales bacterium]|nr:CRISPR-associated endonuclease Cas1 [Magnetococcales bacterium]
MPTLYVTEQGATVRYSGGVLHVTAAHDAKETGKTPHVLLKVEPHRLELVALVGRVHITVDAMQLCLEKGIGVAWFSFSGRCLGRMVPEVARSGDLRLMQYRAVENGARACSLARAVLMAKCTNARAVLSRIQSNQPGLEDVSAVLQDLDARQEGMRACGDLESLMGYEGSVAAGYFSVLRHGFRSEISFVGRQRRPPPDPANALLSFGYVLLGNRIAGILEARGLDPALGFMHAPRPGRASLSLDLLEEFRHPIVDRFVMRVCNLRQIQLHMFEPDPQEGGVRLTSAGLKVFFRAWGDHLERPMREAEGEHHTPLALIHRQVNRLAMALREESDYQPFVLQD